MLQALLMMPFLFAYSIQAQADEVTMAFGVSLPPYVISKSNSGIEIDIIRESLAFKGHTLKTKYVPLARLPQQFISHKVDAVQRDGEVDLTQQGGHYADVSIKYHDVLVTLKESHISINKPADLAGLRVIGFQGAAKTYPEWLQAVQAAGHYYEKNNQILQIRTLHTKRYDVVVADENIINYFTNKVRKEGEIRLFPTETHNFAQPYSYKPVFRSVKIMEDFNAGLKNLHATGRYQQIIDGYLK
jgi:polar amino acid transport system substrate-binding protein